MKKVPVILQNDRLFRIFLSAAMLKLYNPMNLMLNILIRLVCIGLHVFCITHLLAFYKASGEDMAEWKTSFIIGYIWHGTLIGIHIVMLFIILMGL